jgi:dTDP-3-amino-3,4,6-trideoxy-alpha-D-glucose transaminase
MTTEPPIPLIDLRGQYLALQAELDVAVQRAVASGWYILGQEVAAFEQEFAAYLAASGGDIAGCVGVNSGTDALHLALRACGVGPQDEVITVAHTAVATAAAISLSGATPIFVDIDPVTYTMDADALVAAISPRTRAVVVVHLYGHPAPMAEILAVTRLAGLPVIEDCAQAHGARYQGRPVGSFGDLGCYSFYPTKNLGALGDGGAVVSCRPELLEQVRLLREYGWTAHSRYVSQVQGMNSRLDEIQAAILRVKLAHLDQWNERRRALAAHYAQALQGQPDGLVLPVEAPDAYHVYHLYVVRVPQRDGVRQRLLALGVQSAIHYPVPVHLQPAYAPASGQPVRLPHTEAAAGSILSLPMHPLLSEEQGTRVAAALRQVLSELAAAPPPAHTI